tara:strand:- start:107 stop:964 length:858 start_codon:yes stop_codon:yes gene_type:complete
MKDPKIFCMCLYDHHLENLKKLNYIPVGLGKNTFSKSWLKDDTEINIAKKNPFYGEYTFYYWIWKNFLKKIDDNSWIGFTGYRYHWSQDDNIHSDDLNKIINNNNFEEYILKEIPPEWNNVDIVLGQKIKINNWKISKILKHAKKNFFLNPSNFLKSNQNIKLQFDIFHGDGLLDKAISVLDKSDRNDFKDFVIGENSFNRENLFFCKSKKIMNDYFSSIFGWLEKCEKIFGFNLQGYSQKRIYAFLAERYLSYWFNKYTKPLTWPIFFYDTNKNKIEIKNETSK